MPIQHCSLHPMRVCILWEIQSTHIISIHWQVIPIQQPATTVFVSVRVLENKIYSHYCHPLINHRHPLSWRPTQCVLGGQGGQVDEAPWEGACTHAHCFEMNNIQLLHSFSSSLQPTLRHSVITIFFKSASPSLLLQCKGYDDIKAARCWIHIRNFETLTII